MSAEKYAQFIAEQQKKLSVSGTNPVNLTEKKELSDKQKDIAKLAGDKDEIDADDLEKLRKEEVEVEEDYEPASAKKAAKDREHSADAADVAARMRKGKGKDAWNWLSSELKDKADKHARKAVTGMDEASYISEEESAYIEEMVSKGKLNDIADFHKKAADHAYKMRVHHQMMADKSEDVGDSEGFDHHIEQAMRHDYDHEHHLARFDHAASLKARNQAHKDLKAAKDKAAKARDAKRDWA